MASRSPRERLDHFLSALPRPLQEHVQRVRREAAWLARCHRLDEERADLAALAHDVARATPGGELVRQARRYRLGVDPVELQVTVLLHGPVGAAWLRRRFALADDEIRATVRWHSTGHPTLTSLGRAVFLADKIEPVKVRHYPYLQEVRRRARHDLEGAVLHFLDHDLRYRLDRGLPVHPASVAARNGLLRAAPRSGPRGDLEEVEE